MPAPNTAYRTLTILEKNVDHGINRRTSKSRLDFDSNAGVHPSMTTISPDAGKLQISRPASKSTLRIQVDL
ncbi:hypothetical protein D9615_009631 [Tricholomella constricta]|uniref:Uncharacterized protein n=1 Tax=Tricholomella constricta TaxID=117010 RepID=A0A8H5GUV3_9AGAR|nr:hypothetical protein D9615_009628 [Tricholomella constricta]KAF5371501.1 hypothetical protein D9615_009631 [Tricholomella constricta]